MFFFNREREYLEDMRAKVSSHLTYKDGNIILIEAREGIQGGHVRQIDFTPYRQRWPYRVHTF